jgi:hypothetical protein
LKNNKIQNLQLNNFRNISDYKFIKMNTLKIIFLFLATAFIFNHCSEDTETYTKHPVPEWYIESPELLPNSFTAIIAIPDNINIYATDNDQVAAFINDKCRGVGSLVRAGDNDKRVYYITIRADDEENGNITFRYYNSRLSYLYQAKQVIPFETDGTYGTYDSPVILELEHVIN